MVTDCIAHTQNFPSQMREGQSLEYFSTNDLYKMNHEENINSKYCWHFLVADIHPVVGIRQVVDIRRAVRSCRSHLKIRKLVAEFVDICIDRHTLHLGAGCTDFRMDFDYTGFGCSDSGCTGCNFHHKTSYKFEAFADR